MSDRLYFSVPDECDNMLAQRFLRDKCGLSARIITRLKREKYSLSDINHPPNKKQNYQLNNKYYRYAEHKFNVSCFVSD